MSLISYKICCFNCDKGVMHREDVERFYYKYKCSSCGAYSTGLMNGYIGKQYYCKDGKKVYNNNGLRIIERSK